MPSKNPTSAAQIHKGAPKPSKVAHGPGEWQSQLPKGDDSRERHLDRVTSRKYPKFAELAKLG